MLKKIMGFLKKYGIWYTIKKILYKLYVGYVLGPVKVNRRISKKERVEQEAYSFMHPYCFSIVVPLYNTPENFLRQMLDSVCLQTYRNWQLCLADGSDTEHGEVQNICEEYAKKDDRICYQKLDKNHGISENTNVCIDMAYGEYIALFDHDDLLHPSALFEVMRCIDENNADFIYTDEATFLGRVTHLLSVHEKPDFYMENLCANNYICHFTVFRKELLQKTGAFRKEYDGSQDYDLILRLCEAASMICHIPKVLYFWRAHKDSVALAIDSKNYAVDAGLRAVRAHFERCHISVKIDVEAGAMPIYQIQYQIGDLKIEDITIIREGNNDIRRKTFLLGDYILLLKKEFVQPEKEELSAMLMHMAKPTVAAVTAKIVSKRGRILSGGVKLCADNRLIKVQHLFYKVPVYEPGDMKRLTYASGIPAICNGCMLVRKELIAGMLNDDEELFNMGNWLRLSLQLTDQGYELINELTVIVNSITDIDFPCIQTFTMV